MSDLQPVDAELEPILSGMIERKASRPDMASLSANDIRFRARNDFAKLNANPRDIAFVEDLTLEGAFGPRRVRIYDAQGTRKDAPALIYFHGGGWIVGDLDMEDAKLRCLAEASHVRIVSVDYVLAPEHKFPAPLEDCIAVARSARNDAERLGVDPARLAIGGASAGANLALSTAISLRDTNHSWLRFMLLFYGVFDMNSASPSRSLFDQKYGLDTATMEFFYSTYLTRRPERADRRASPLIADLNNLPPAYINAAGLDILRDDSRDLAEKLRRENIAVKYTETTGAIHGYTLFADKLSVARTSIIDAGHALRSALA